MNFEDYLNGQIPEDEVFIFAREGYAKELREVLTSENVNKRDHRGNTPLLLAAYYGHADVVRLLLNMGADTEMRDHAGNTALMDAVYRGYDAIVRLLVEHGANPTLKNDKGLSAMGFANVYGRDEIRNYLADATHSSGSRFNA